jgi:O-antigen/teichoic acid export membrane protein
MLLCLSAAPRVIGESVAQLTRATGQSHIDARWNVWSTPIFLVVVMLGTSEGLLGTAIAICVFHWLYQSLFVTSTLFGMFGRRSPNSALPARI